MGPEWVTEAETGVIQFQAKGRMSRLACSQQKLRERHGRDSPSEPPEGTNPANTWMLASRTRREGVSVVLGHQVCGNLLGPS